MPMIFPRHGAIFAKELANDLADQGYCEKQIFRGTGLSWALLEPEKPVAEFDRVAALFENAARLTNDDLLGFVRGQAREMRRSGLISYVGLSSPTIMDFVKNVARYRRVFSDAVEMDCDTLESDGILKWHFSVPVSVERRQTVEFATSGLINTLREIAHVEFSPERVTFRHARNTNVDAFERYFGCDVGFGASENTFHFKPDDLALPLITADAELFRVLRNCCEHALEIKARNVPLLIVGVERAISDRLTKGEVTQVEIARALGMGPRTLSRRLADEGTTFFRTLEGLRKALAVNYLRDSGLALAEIAYLLGYSGLGSFSDAFKRWTGKTPSLFRKG